MLERHGLFSVERLEAELGRRDCKQISDLLESIADLLPSEVAAGAESSSDLSFTAGSYVRGDGGCSHWECRQQKLEALARYTALYADRVTVPVRMPHHHGHDGCFRKDALCLISTLLTLRHVLDAGLVILIRPRVPMCFVHNSAQEELLPILKCAKTMYKELLPKFSITFEGGCEHRQTFRLSGPPEFIEHGSILWEGRKFPKWAPKRLLKAHRLPMRLSNTAIERSPWIRGIDTSKGEPETSRSSGYGWNRPLCRPAIGAACGVIKGLRRLGSCHAVYRFTL